MMLPVTLQISLAPSDYGHSVYLLSHQIRAFGNQVNEILLTYDTHKSKGRFSVNWEENNHLMWNFLEQYAASNPKIRLLKIDYTKEKVKEVGNFFFGKHKIPAKDWRGGPFYTYFFGLYEARNQFVFHIDSDLFFGGLSQNWLKEALRLYQSDPQILFINPLAGPPTLSGELFHQQYFFYQDLKTHFGFHTMSTRLYLVDRDRLATKKLKHIHTLKPRELVRALLKGNPPYKLPEEFLSEHMRTNKMVRVDFKGENEGIWSLHPPYRTPKFYEELPSLIKKIENNHIPNAQRGHYDIVNELFDWSEARLKLKI